MHLRDATAATTRRPPPTMTADRTHDHNTAALLAHLSRTGRGSSTTAALLRDLQTKGGAAAFAAYNARRSPIGEACAAYAIFCEDARVPGADLAAWTDADSRAALVPAFDSEI